MISDLKERISKTGKKYCFLSLSDDTGIVDAICFSEVIDSLNSNLKVGEIILVKLSYQNVNNFKKFTVSSVTILDDSNKSINDYLISLDTKKLDLKKLEKLLMATNTGKTNFFFKIFHGNHEIKIKSNKQFNANIDLLHSLKNTEGIIDITKLI